MLRKKQLLKIRTNGLDGMWRIARGAELKAAAARGAFQPEMSALRARELAGPMAMAPARRELAGCVW